MVRLMGSQLCEFNRELANTKSSGSTGAVVKLSVTGRARSQPRGAARNTTKVELKHVEGKTLL
jgi:hypothetical protein